MTAAWISLGKLHRPKFYRYRVADRGFRWTWNTCSGDVCAKGRRNVIGAAFVVGSHAYCVKWGKPTSRSTYDYVKDVLDSLGDDQ